MFILQETENGVVVVKTETPANDNHKERVQAPAFDPKEVNGYDDGDPSYFACYG